MLTLRDYAVSGLTILSLLVLVFVLALAEERRMAVRPLPKIGASHGW